MNANETAPSHQHSPLPWGIHDGLICDARNSIVSEVTQYDDFNPKEADAEFIVRACNSHYELLAALKALLENDAVNVWLGGNPNVVNAIVQQGLDAIAKAESR